jgi:hypothetical protein
MTQEILNEINKLNQEYARKNTEAFDLMLKTMTDNLTEQAKKTKVLFDKMYKPKK